MTETDHPFNLAARIIRGALKNDAVQLHGAIVATLETHPVADAVEDVFTPSVRSLTGTARHRASVAMGGHLAEYLNRQPPPLALPHRGGDDAQSSVQPGEHLYAVPARARKGERLAG